MADFTGFQVLIQQQQIDQEIESKIDRTQSFKKNGKTQVIKGSPSLNSKLKNINEDQAIDEEPQYGRQARSTRIVSIMY